MRPFSSQATATGSTTNGSAATSSTFKPGSVFKYLSDSSGVSGPSIAQAEEAIRSQGKRAATGSLPLGGKRCQLEGRAAVAGMGPISVFYFLEQVHRGVHQHFADARLDAGISDFVAALG